MVNAHMSWLTNVGMSGFFADLLIIDTCFLFWHSNVEVFVAHQTEWMSNAMYWSVFGIVRSKLFSFLVSHNNEKYIWCAKHLLLWWWSAWQMMSFSDLTYHSRTSMKQMSGTLKGIEDNALTPPQMAIWQADWKTMHDLKNYY